MVKKKEEKKKKIARCSSDSCRDFYGAVIFFCLTQVYPCSVVERQEVAIAVEKKAVEQIYIYIYIDAVTQISMNLFAILLLHAGTIVCTTVTS